MASVPIHRIVRVNYWIRTGAFAFSFLVIGLHGAQKGLGALFWVLLAAQFLVYPHLVYLRARRAENGKEAEIQNMFLDATLLGAWTGGLHFPLWIAYGAVFSTTLNAAALRGMQGGLASLACFCVGAALAVAGTGFGYSPMTSDVVTALTFSGSLGYSLAIGNVMYMQRRWIAVARAEQETSEARYRLLAENAADLVALVDTGGRWLYVSPSYERLLEPEDIEHGADAFRRVHPDDADLARVAVTRAAATAKPRELPLRLVDREGRIHQLRMRVQPVNGDGRPVTRLILASQDVTDLRESEERLLLQAHALEGMTEAILITAADGTILTVNRAFCQITGYERDEVLGSPEKAIRNALQPPEFYDDVFAIVHRDGYWSGTSWNRRRNGSVYREWRSVRAVRGPEDRVTHYVMVFYEVGGAREPNVGENPLSA